MSLLHFKTLRNGGIERRLVRLHRVLFLLQASRLLRMAAIETFREAVGLLRHLSAIRRDLFMERGTFLHKEKATST